MKQFLKTSLLADNLQEVINRLYKRALATFEEAQMLEQLQPLLSPEEAVKTDQERKIKRKPGQQLDQMVKDIEQQERDGQRFRRIMRGAFEEYLRGDEEDGSNLVV